MVSTSVWIHDSTLLALQRATHASLSVLSTALADLELTPSEINALANLSDGVPRTVSELGSAAGIRPTTMTGVLDRLERRGHVTRGTRSGDRRAVIIELTATGRQAAARVHRAFVDLERGSLRRLSADARSGLRAGLDALSQATP